VAESATLIFYFHKSVRQIKQGKVRISSQNMLYKSVKNPLLLKPEKSLPRSVAMIGAGIIGTDIGYYLKSALPDIKLYLVDVAEEPLKRAEKRLAGYTRQTTRRCYGRQVYPAGCAAH
jgi:pyruvate/2-oxoglutarate dehydrogenase complex dihydrolipoamide dehydrogenase (E3) component